MLLSTDTEIRQAEVTQLRNTGAIVFGCLNTEPLEPLQLKLQDYITNRVRLGCS